MSEAGTTSCYAEKLSKQHKRKNFDCGRASLNRYLGRQASQDQRRHVAAPFVVCDDDERVIGYYTLSAISVDASGLDGHTAHRLPNYPEIPAILLGRLAVDQSQKGKGLGRRLLVDALFRAFRQSGEIGAWAVIVDAIDDEGVAFYTHFGFQQFEDNPSRLFLPMTAIAKL